MTTTEEPDLLEALIQQKEHSEQIIQMNMLILIMSGIAIFNLTFLSQFINQPQHPSSIALYVGQTALYVALLLSVTTIIMLLFFTTNNITLKQEPQLGTRVQFSFLLSFIATGIALFALSFTRSLLPPIITLTVILCMKLLDPVSKRFSKRLL